METDETLPRVLYGDDVRMKQIVTNLLTNAVKYTPQGSVRLRVAYERRSGEEELLLKISVQDTGIGIRKEDMGKLFESFQRLDEEKNRNIEGTGLGMNITMSLLKMMDGDMKVESEYQKGSVFTVIIPQKIVSNEPAGSFRKMQENNARHNNSRQSTFTAPKGRVLVVDDNTMNLTVFQALLKRTKLQVVTAQSGRQCLDYVQKQKFHMIFMDHMMPEMDGIETLHQIEKLAERTDFPNKGTPVIALTANAVAGVREMYLAQGFAEFLTKPVNAELLEHTICKYLPEELIQTVKGKETDGDPAAENGADAFARELEQEWANALEALTGIYETYAPAQEEPDLSDSGALLELPQERLDEMAALIDDFQTDAAVHQIREWLDSPLHRDMKRRLTDVLAAIEDEFDEDKAIGLLKENTEESE